MEVKLCPRCNTRVLPRADGACPGCGDALDAVPLMSTSESESYIARQAAAFRPRRPRRPHLAIIGGCLIVLGGYLAIMSIFAPVGNRYYFGKKGALTASEIVADLEALDSTEDFIAPYRQEARIARRNRMMALIPVASGLFLAGIVMLRKSRSIGIEAG